MFDIGFLELVVIAILSLLVMGPERLPGAIRTASLWLGRIRRSFNQIKTEIEREIGADDIRRQLHNETVLENLKKTKSDLLEAADSFAPEAAQEMQKLKQNLEYDIDDVVKPASQPPAANKSSS